MIGKKLRKIIKEQFLNFCMLKKEKYSLPMFQNITQIVKQVILLMIPSGEGRHYLTLKKLSALLKGKTSK